MDDQTPQQQRLAVAYLTLAGPNRGDRRVSVRALRDLAKVSTAAAAEYLRTVSSTEDFALSGLDTQALLRQLLESLAEQARVDARAAVRQDLNAAHESEADALQQLDALTEQVRQLELRAAADAATIAALREQIPQSSRP